MIGAAILLLLQAAPAAPGDWKQFSSGDYGAEIEVGSIARNGDLRTFRMRSTKKGASKWAIVAITLDCKARTMTLGVAELYEGDTRTGTNPADPAAAPISLAGDPSGTAIGDFVCAK